MTESKQTVTDEPLAPSAPAPSTPEPSAPVPLIPMLMNNIGIVIGLLVAFGAGMCVSGGEASKDTTGTGASEEHEHQPTSEWTCPMHAQIRSDQAGACPICGMDLVEVEIEPTSDEAPANNTITLSERSKQLARIRTTELTSMATATRELRLLGRIGYDETRIKRVTAWTAGRIDRLHVATTGKRIRAGQSVAKLYSPEIYSAQADLIQAAKQLARLESANDIAKGAARAALDAARQRLRLLGVSKKQLKVMQAAKTPARHTWIRTPFAGTVIERLVDEGNYVNTGTALYRVADLSKVWVQLDAYETDMPLVKVGDQVEFHVVGIPEQSFNGRVSFIDPVVDAGTRIVKVRVEVDNPDGQLRPGMFTEATLHSERASAATLMLPRSAPLFTGRRSVVYVEVPGDDRLTYQARDVVLGNRAGDWYPVISGLSAGERVVVRGAFVIDADLQIKGGESMMTRTDDITRRAEQPVEHVPERIIERLARQVQTYLRIGAALAGEQFEDARKTSRQLAADIALTTVEMPATLRPRWNERAEQFAADARFLSGRERIARARQVYRKLSAHTEWLVNTFGNPLDQALTIAICQDDGDPDGVRWLQTASDIANPYRVSTQPVCGQVHTTVQPRSHGEPHSPAPAHTGSAGHVH